MDDCVTDMRHLQGEVYALSLRQYKLKVERFAVQVAGARKLAPIWAQVFSGDDEILAEGFAYMEKLDCQLEAELQGLPEEQQGEVIRRFRRRTAKTVARRIRELAHMAALVEQGRWARMLDAGLAC